MSNNPDPWNDPALLANAPGAGRIPPQEMPSWQKAEPVAPWFKGPIRGWLDPREGELLTRLGTGKMVLEIGSYCGLSTLYLARHAVNVWCVDPFDGRGTPCPGDTLAEFRENMGRNVLLERVVPLVMESKDFLTRHPDCRASFDLVFIDGAHDADSVRADIGVALAALAKGGLVAVHDFGEIAFREVSQVVAEELFAKGARMVARVGSVVAVDPFPLPGAP